MNKTTYLLSFVLASTLTACASNPVSVPESRPGSIGSNSDSGVADTSISSSASASSNATPDADGDGIADRVDLCAGSTPDSLVDASGCEIVTGVIEGLKFAPNETRLSVDSRVVLSKLVDVFLRYPDVTLAVEGHTDNRGPAAANLELSKQRVLSVVRYMVSNGINPDRLKPFGYGESRPRAANATEEGREQNRRIEINVVDSLL